jgi:hypothetical protein
MGILTNLSTVRTYPLTEEHIVELEAALDAVDGTDIMSISRDSFALPTLGPVLQRIRDEVLWGRGFALMRGLPVERWSQWRCAAAYYGMGTYLGDAVAQNAKGHVLGDPP